MQIHEPEISHVRLAPRLLAVAIAITAASLVPASAAEPATAPSSEVVASREGVVLFSRICMMSGGHRQVVEPLLDRMPEEALVRRMSVDRVARLHDGAYGGAGWSVTSPTGNAVVIDFAPDGRCSARVERADGGALEQAAERMMQSLTRDGKSRVSKTTAAGSGQGAAARRRIDFVLSAQGQQTSATVSVTIGDDGSAHQGVLTFAVARPPT